METGNLAHCVNTGHRATIYTHSIVLILHIQPLLCSTIHLHAMDTDASYQLTYLHAFKMW